ncbi:GntR family transcriptional regulator [Ancylobacter sp. MQZ15Z-1]|uniref:GntR family transcriptional regulator n=1 Tax=Ancylobacter mangrovi TaxID=2972472 RepID=A0A9X2PFP1_9HYPH|nr:GntR family transcriptional regulator [Ancylobacter mangrovi]MCS0493753.1 GntR family transcriptional regulator [Ancylobacter mangrovi]
MPVSTAEHSLPLEAIRDLAHRDVSGRAKYAVFTECLRTMILGGSLPAGARLPTERELATLSGLSLGTVQRSLRSLVEEGYLTRAPKVGSFVTERTQIRQPWHCRFLSDDGKTVLPVSPTTRRRLVTNEVGPWTKHLGPAAGGYLYIERNFDVAGEFSVDSRFWGDANRLSALRLGHMAQLDGENLKHLIASKCHLPVTRVVHKLRYAIREREPASLILTALTWSHGAPLYYQEFRIPPNGRELLVSDELDQHFGFGGENPPHEG